MSVRICNAVLTPVYRSNSNLACLDTDCLVDLAGTYRPASRVQQKSVGRAHLLFFLFLFDRYLYERRASLSKNQWELAVPFLRL